MKKYKKASDVTYVSRFAPRHQLFVLEDLFKDGRDETILYQLQYTISSNTYNLEKLSLRIKKINLIKSRA